MAFNFDEDSNKISMPPGDTGDLHLQIEWDTHGKDAVVVFAIVNRRTGVDMMIKAAEIVNGYAHIRLCNHDTRNIAPGTYQWQIRLVTSPAHDADGNVIADECTDDVISVFTEMPTFVIQKGGARV